jgi:hypothetical protein
MNSPIQRGGLPTVPDQRKKSRHARAEAALADVRRLSESGTLSGRKQKRVENV